MNIIKDIIDYITKLLTWWIIIMPWEQGIRVSWGKKTKLLTEGVFLKVPLMHTIYVQERRLRVIDIPMQTICTKDGHPITISCSAGYSIKDIVKLYNSLYQPDLTVINIVASNVSKQIFDTVLSECNPLKIEENVKQALDTLDYGLQFEYIRILNFASVKTYRLIQDHTNMWEGLDLKIPK